MILGMRSTNASKGWLLLPQEIASSKPGNCNPCQREFGQRLSVTRDGEAMLVV